MTTWDRAGSVTRRNRVPTRKSDGSSRKPRRKGSAFEVPRLSLSSGPAEEGTLTIGNGRHRWAWFRDTGQRFQVVSVHPSEAAEITRKFGAKAKP